MGCVYKLVFPNGKCYVGMTLGTAEDRLQRHCKDANPKSRMAVHHALLKYGQDVKMQVLFTSDDRETLMIAEQQFIFEHGTRAPAGYNLTAGGDGCPKLDEETEQRRRAAISKSLIGKKLSLSHRESLSRSHIGKPSSRKGAVLTEETKKRQSQAAKARWKRDRTKIMAQRSQPEYLLALSKGVERSWQRRR